jgi:hypothetical protein
VACVPIHPLNRAPQFSTVSKAASVGKMLVSKCPAAVNSAFIAGQEVPATVSEQYAKRHSTAFPTEASVGAAPDRGFCLVCLVDGPGVSKSARYSAARIAQEQTGERCRGTSANVAALSGCPEYSASCTACLGPRLARGLFLSSAHQCPALAHRHKRQRRWAYL